MSRWTTAMAADHGVEDAAIAPGACAAVSTRGGTFRIIHSAKTGYGRHVRAARGRSGQAVVIGT